MSVNEMTHVVSMIAMLTSVAGGVLVLISGMITVARRRKRVVLRVSSERELA